jgi:hypothetical protein
VAELYGNKVATSIIVCGSQGYKVLEKNVLSEAEAYANFLYELGISSRDVYLETESQETLGNLLFAKMHIIMKHNWHSVLVIPTIRHSTERIEYLLNKILGADYSWEILRIGEDKDPANLEREAKALKNTKEINDKYEDGDHQAVYDGLMETHPAYGGTKWTIEELRKEMEH